MHCFQYCIFRGLEVVSAQEQTPRNSCGCTYSEQPLGLHPLLCPGMLSSGRSKVISSCVYISVLLGQADFSTRAGVSPGYMVSLLLWVTFALLQQEGWQREEMGLIQQGDAVCFYPVLFEIVECSPDWHGSIHCLAVISHVEYSPKIRHMS